MQTVTPEAAVAGIQSGDQVYIHCAAAVPSVLLDVLVARAQQLERVGVVHLHIEGPGPHLAADMATHFRHRALFIGPNARAAVNEGRADYVPVFLSATTWPVRSTSIAELIATMLLNERITCVSLVKSTGRIATIGLSSTKS